MGRYLENEPTVLYDLFAVQDHMGQSIRHGHCKLGILTSLFARFLIVFSFRYHQSHKQQ